MRRLVPTATFAAFCSIAGATAAEGPKAKLTPVESAKTMLVPAAQLMRVDEGVFEVIVGSTIDLTNRKILLGVSMRRRDECCNITLNGRNSHWNGVGHRFDLKELTSTREFVKDKRVCVLDVVDVAVPRGGKGVLTFRLHCL